MTLCAALLPLVVLAVPLSAQMIDDASQSPPERLGRSLTIEVSPEKTTVEIAISLDRDDEEAARLVRGEQDLVQFIDSRFDGPRFAESSISWWFANVRPDIAIDGDAIVVRAAANGPPATSEGDLGEWIEIAGDDGFQAGGESDRLELFVTDDYALSRLAPLPMTATNRQAIWTGEPAEEGTAERVRRFAIELQDPNARLPPAAPSIWALIGLPISHVGLLLRFDLNTLGDAIRVSLPMVLVLWWCHLRARRYRLRGHSPPDHALWLGSGQRYARRAAHQLIAVAFAPALIALAQRLAFTARVYVDDLAYADYPVIGPLWAALDRAGNSSWFLKSAAVTLIVIFLVGMATILLRLLLAGRDAGGIRFWLRSYAAGCASGALLAIVLILLLTEFLALPQWIGHEPVTLLVGGAVALWLALKARTLSRKMGGIAWPAAVTLIVALVAVLSALPVHSLVRSTAELSVAEVSFYGVKTYLDILQLLVPLALLAGLLARLKALSGTGDSSWRAQRALAAVLFAGYIVLPDAHDISGLLAFPLAIWLLLNRGFKPHRQIVALKSLVSEVHAKRVHWIKRALAAASAKTMSGQRQKLGDRLSSGEISPQEYERTARVLDGYGKRRQRQAEVTPGIEASDVVLNFGPFPDDWRNGLYAARIGSLIGAVIIAIEYYRFPLSILENQHPFPLLSILVGPLVDFLSFAVSGFFFGYFFSVLRGSSGLTKGLYLAGLILLGKVLVWHWLIFPNFDFVALGWRASQIVLFFVLIGVLAFDFTVMRRELGDGFNWSRFTWFGNVRGFTIGAGALAGSLGVAINSVISARFTEVVGQFLTPLITTPPPVPPS